MQISARDEKLYGIRCLKCLQRMYLLLLLCCLFKLMQGTSWQGIAQTTYKGRNEIFEIFLISKLNVLHSRQKI